MKVQITIKCNGQPFDIITTERFKSEQELKRLDARDLVTAGPNGHYTATYRVVEQERKKPWYQR